MAQRNRYGASLRVPVDFDSSDETTRDFGVLHAHAEVSRSEIAKLGVVLGEIEFALTDVRTDADGEYRLFSWYATEERNVA
jgi:hypothetical protein